jgi:hypothetical protein
MTSSATVPSDFPMQIEDSGYCGRSMIMPGAFLWNYGGYSVPIYCSIKHTELYSAFRDVEDGYLVLPGFKLTAYNLITTTGDYENTDSTEYNNTNGDTIKYFSTNTDKENYVASIKLEYKGDPIRQDSFERSMTGSYPTNNTGYIWYHDYSNNTRTIRQADVTDESSSHEYAGYLESNPNLKGNNFPFRSSESNNQANQAQVIPGAWGLNWNNSSFPIFGNQKFGSTPHFNDSIDHILLLPHFGIKLHVDANFTSGHDEYKNNTGEVVNVNPINSNDWASAVQLYYNAGGFATNQSFQTNEHVMS